MGKHRHQDHKMKKQTSQETYLHEKIDNMRNEFELRMLNIVAQVRATCIAVGITPDKFLEAFNDYDKQNEFFKVLDVREKEIIAKRTEEMEKAKKVADQFAGKEAVPQTPEMEDAIMGPGDKIV